MALTTEEQELFDIGRGNLPEWYASDARANEFLGACAKLFGTSRSISSRWLQEMTLLTLASADVDEPDFLDQHARDRGTSRQSGETDEALVKRLRTVEDALTRPFLLAQVQAMMTAAGFSGTPQMVELPRDVAHFGSYTSMGGDGVCVIEKVTSTVCLFTPPPAALPWPRPPFQRAPSAAPTFKLTISTGGGPNDGTFTITGLVGNKVQYTNAGGSNETTAPDAVWAVARYDVEGNLRDGFARAYFGRGYRMGHSPPPAIIVILPFGTTEGFAASVLEMLRQKKGAGIYAAVERRLSP